MNFKNVNRVVKVATIGIVTYLLIYGIATALFPIRPFWNDEWRLIYNIKFKNVSQLWGVLDLLQECPRCYLTLLKEITSFFDYSYTSLRLPALIIGFASIFFIFHLKKKALPGGSTYSYLFILIFVSAKTFTDYITQTKQYEMELFLCLLALWQFITLLELFDKGKLDNKYTYFLLCFSFLVAPFFSYTYPISIAPVFPIIILKYIAFRKNGEQRIADVGFWLTLSLPLVIVTISTIVFYYVDVKQVMADHRMYLSYMTTYHKCGKEYFIEDFWDLFSGVGSGFLYEIIFGIIGIAAFFYGIYKLALVKKFSYTKDEYIRLYSVFLLFATLCLFLSGKLLGGVARLTDFTVPSISILIVSFFEDLKYKYRYFKVTNVIAAVLFVGLFGNILTTCINRFTYPEYSNWIITYWNTSAALKKARLEKVPLLYTDAVRGRADVKRQSIFDIVPILFTYRVGNDTTVDRAPAPGEVRSNTIDSAQIAGTEVLCAEVILKVNPEYKVWDTIPVYLIPDTRWVGDYVKQLPTDVKSVYVCDGINYMKVDRL